MKNRRHFIKTGLAATFGVAVAAPLLGQNHKSLTKLDFPGLIYTRENQGMWKNKAESHLPQIKIDGGKITLTTNHGMSETHYIVRHTLVDSNGKVIGTKTFYPTDEPVSTYTLPEGYKGTLYATSFCNKHDFWVNEFKV
ncbi:MAG: desulfoferrodoxin [Bacteroidetes bacterium]|nr:MAG: desulfoferrodoxin [Bacteroidota bacterium]